MAELDDAVEVLDVDLEPISEEPMYYDGDLRGFRSGYGDDDVEVLDSSSDADSLRSAGASGVGRSGARVGGRSPVFFGGGDDDDFGTGGELEASVVGEGAERYEGGGFAGADALDAVDVTVTAVEADEEERAAQRNAVFLDAFLLTVEAVLGTMANRASQLLTPEAARSWELLRAFRGQRSPLEQKRQRAKEKLLDEIAEGVRRK